MKTCAYCGAESTDEAATCPGCGSPVPEPAASPVDPQPFTQETGGLSRPLLWLGCSALIMVLCFWYPFYVDGKWGVDHEGKPIDSRMGVVFLGALPFILCAWGMAAWHYSRLIRACRPFHRPAAKCACLAGSLLLAVSLGPIVAPLGKAFLRLP